MRPPPTWPELDRLARFVRAADSLTDTLATWTGRGLDVQIVHRLDRVFPDPAIAEFLALHEGDRVQERAVRMHSGGLVVAEARSWVAVDSAALTPAVRLSLRSGGSLGDLLRPLQRRRTAVRVVPQAGAPTTDPGAEVLAVQARLDVAGTPVAWCEETVFAAVFAWDARPLRSGRTSLARPCPVPAARPAIPA